MRAYELWLTLDDSVCEGKPLDGFDLLHLPAGPLEISLPPSFLTGSGGARHSAYFSQH